MDVDDIETIAVLGAGSMGHGIAEVAALAGFQVNMRDINQDLVQDGYEQIEWSLGKLAERDQIGDDEQQATLERVTPLVDVEETVANADFVIEAVPEQMDIKKDVFDEVEQYLPDHAIITSNTSSLSITELSEVTERPEKFCGMHFFNPPVRMQLVEVISGAHTAEETLDITEELAEAFGKTPVRVHKDSPGFIANRVLVPLMNEACWLVSTDDATIPGIDSTMKFDMGLPMGGFELGDQVGTDVIYHVLEYMHEVLGDAYEPAPFLEEVVEDERYGKKTGEGFYNYEDGGVDIPTDAGSDEIERILVGVMANEVAKLIENDVSNPADIDEALMLGAGFPKGPAKLADQHGLDDILATLEDRYEETDHPRYEPADYLTEAAAKDGFYGDDETEGGPEFTNIMIHYPGQMVGHIELDREARMNTISPDLLSELDQAIDILTDDEGVRAILVTGTGDRAFSAGADVTGMAGSADPIDAIELSRKGQRVFGKLEECDLPVVAGIDGYALGGGMELATCADLRVASERAEFGQPELNLGLLPGWGGTQRLQHIVGEGRAKEIILTAERYDAEEMADYGFINEVVATDEFDERAFELAVDLAAGPPIAQKFVKRAMLKGWEDTEAGLEIEAMGFGHLLNTDDLMEGVTAFMNDEEPEFEGQ